MEITYLKKLQERYKYFESKPITELTRDEIDEYLRLIDEIQSEMSEVIKAVEKVWENILDHIKETPEYKAEMKYRERVGDNT